MIVCRIVRVSAFANQPDEKVSVYSFVVMKWHETEIVQTKGGSKQEDRNHSDAPNFFRQVALCRHTHLRLLARSFTPSAAVFRAGFFTAPICRACTHQLLRLSESD